MLLSAVDKLLFQAQFSHEKIRQKIPGLQGKPQSIIIVASWRTGSTFLAQLVASGLKNMRFFIYEPLLPRVISRKKLVHRIHSVGKRKRYSLTVWKFQKLTLMIFFTKVIVTM